MELDFICPIHESKGLIMSKRITLLAAALAALAFAAFPTVASAGTPEIHCPNGALECNVSITGGHSEWTKTGGFASVTCTSTTGSGTLKTTTGTISLLYHGCKDSVFGGACTTSGLTSGTVETTALTFHTTYLTAGKTVPGILLTPNAVTGVIAHFSCIDGNHTVTGNGLMGRIESGCTSPVSPLNVVFEQSQAGHPLHKQITGTGTIFDLADGGATTAMKSTESITAAGGGNFTVTCV